MSLDRISTPAGSGDALLIPDPREYGQLVENNRNLSNNAMIAGEPLAELAKEARKFAIDSATKYTARLGFNVAGMEDPDGPIIATGHQPIIFHPGIAIKIFAMVTGARDAGITPLFISQDCDEFRAETILAPMIDNSLVKRSFTLFPQSKKGTYETAEVEPPSMLEERLNNLRSRLDDPMLQNIAGAMDGFLSRLEQKSMNSKSFTSRTIIMRRAWEGTVPGDYLDSSVSALCGSRPYRVFSSNIIRKLNEFTTIYNNELQQYRILHKLRYPANPFPDLAKVDKWEETPFWVMAGGGREKLFARSSGGEITIKSDHLEESPLDEVVNGGVTIRPRAIVLSIYQRLFLCDLFIHGVGGAKYDTITDKIINRFYRLTPPSYACVSATLFPDIPVQDHQAKLAAAHQTLRDIDQRPESVAQNFPEIALTIEPLKLAKEALIARIREPSADKKSLGAEIGDLNARMSQLFSPVKKAVTAEIGRLGKLQKECDAAHSRDYPYFFYRPEEVMNLLTGAGGVGAGSAQGKGNFE